MAAIALGAVLAVGPYLAARSLVSGHVLAEGLAETASAAGDIVARMEVAIERGLDALGALASAGVTGCSAADLEHVRRAAAAAHFAREVAVLDRDGVVVCNQLGEGQTFTDRSQALPIASNANVHMRVAAVGPGREPALMLSWRLDSGIGLAITLSPEAAGVGFMPGPLRGIADTELALTDGTVLARAPGATTERGEIEVASDLASTRYPIHARVAAPLAVFQAQNKALDVAVNAAGAAVALLALSLVGYALRRRPASEDAIREGIARSEFVPYYQPVIDIQHGRLMGCEVLMRWRKPDGTTVPPSAFIPLAEATGLAIPMTRLLMQKTRDELEKAYGDRPHLKVSINLFNDHFATPGIVSDVRAIFASSRIGLDQVVLEVTERHPMPDTAGAREIIRRLQELGARVALDDAGTGHSGLAHLQRLGMDVLKIDKLFIDAIGKDGQPVTVVDSLIRLGQDLGMEVVAEGVEHPHQVSYLRGRGVFAAQGFLFAPPLPGNAFLRLIESMEPVPAGAPANSDAPPRAAA